MKFGELIQEILHTMRMENKELAEKMGGIHPSNITRYLQLETATDKLINRIEQALDIEIMQSEDGGYFWIRGTGKESSSENQSNEPISKYTSTPDYLKKARELVKKRLHDAIIEACMSTPEEHRAEVFKYFLRFQDNAEL